MHYKLGRLVCVLRATPSHGLTALAPLLCSGRAGPGQRALWALAAEVILRAAAATATLNSALSPVHGAGWGFGRSGCSGHGPAILTLAATLTTGPAVLMNLLLIPLPDTLSGIQGQSPNMHQLMQNGSQICKRKSRGNMPTAMSYASMHIAAHSRLCTPCT